MPQRIEDGGRAAAHAALRTTFHGRLEILVKRDTAGVEGFATADLGAQCPDTSGIDADTGALGNIAHHCRRRGIDGVQTVITLDEHTGAELAGRGAHPGHDGGRQRDLEGGAGIIEAFDILQSARLRIAGEETGRYQHVEKLRAFEDFACHPVLHQILALKLLDGGISKLHIAFMVQVLIQLLEFSLAVVTEQVGIVTAGIHQLFHMFIQSGRSELTIGLFAQMKHGQTGGQILVIWRISTDKIGGGPDQRFMNICRLDAVIELDMSP